MEKAEIIFDQLYMEDILKISQNYSLNKNYDLTFYICIHPSCLYNCCICHRTCFACSRLYPYNHYQTLNIPSYQQYYQDNVSKFLNCMFTIFQRHKSHLLARNIAYNSSSTIQCHVRKSETRKKP